MDIKPPAFSKDSYRNWKKDIEIWSLLSPEPENKQGSVICLYSLTQDAKSLVLNELTDEDLSKPLSRNFIFDILDKYFLPDPNQEVIDSFNGFVHFTRPDSMSIQEFLIASSSKLANMRSMGIQLPQPVLANLLLTGAKLSPFHMGLCRAITSDTWCYEEMRNLVARVASSYDHTSEKLRQENMFVSSTHTKVASLKLSHDDQKLPPSGCSFLQNTSDGKKLSKTDNKTLLPAMPSSKLLVASTSSHKPIKTAAVQPLQRPRNGSVFSMSLLARKYSETQRNVSPSITNTHRETHKMASPSISSTENNSSMPCSGKHVYQCDEDRSCLDVRKVARDRSNLRTIHKVGSETMSKKLSLENSKAPSRVVEIPQSIPDKFELQMLLSPSSICGESLTPLPDTQLPIIRECTSPFSDNPSHIPVKSTDDHNASHASNESLISNVSNECFSYVPNDLLTTLKACSTEKECFVGELKHHINNYSGRKKTSVALTTPCSSDELLEDIDPYKHFWALFQQSKMIDQLLQFQQKHLNWLKKSMARMIVDVVVQYFLFINSQQTASNRQEISKFGKTGLCHQVTSGCNISHAAQSGVT